MAFFSQNSYSANDRSVIVKYTIGQTKSVNLRKGSTGELLAHMANWFDANIRDIDPGQLDEWGYAERDIRGSTEVSNHASGTAVDVDATKWPLGSDPSKYLTATEIARIRQQLKVYEGCIRWGGDYAGRKDPMHFEINRDQATCDRVWAKLQSQGDDMAQKDIDEIQRKLSLLLGVELVAGVRDSRERTPGEQFMQAAIPNANGDTKATVAVTTVGNLLQDVQANAWYAGRESGAPVVDVDEEAVAAALLPQLAPLVTTHLTKLSDADIDHIAIAVADEQARRQAA